MADEAMIDTDRLAKVLRVERRSASNAPARFTGSAASEPGSVRVFGGQLVAQAMLAAYGTVADRRIHALHTHFLRPAGLDHDIDYDVEETRSGRSFAVRQVRASQQGRLLVIMSASFHGREDGVEHQEGGTVPAPPADRAAVTRWQGVATVPSGRQGGSDGLRDFWMRFPGSIGDDPAVADAAIAYASDILTGSTPLLRHDQRWDMVRNASLDHSLWFHRPSDPRQWHHVSLRSPVAIGARGLTQGRILDREGLLVASLSQESLIRRHPG
jgi:acyl-CoA thioesterase-2